MEMFGDFNGIEFEELIEFYQHEQHWSNRMILGDSLMVMTSLAEKEGLKGQVQMIYIDPPYGIKFGSNWQVSTRKRDVKDGREEDLVRQPEQIRAFRDTWERGIHSYLSYLRDRLVIARELLSESGSIFVQIGDENVHLVRSVLDEVFGSENFCSLIPFSKSTGLGSTLLKTVNDYIIWYAKDRSKTKYRQLYLRRLDYVGYTHYQLSDGSRHSLGFEQAIRPELLPHDHQVFRTDNLSSSGLTPSCVFDYTYQGVLYSPATNRSWKTNPRGMENLARAGR
jgi:adenine-specific DNA-methyltransferase